MDGFSRMNARRGRLGRAALLLGAGLGLFPRGASGLYQDSAPSRIQELARNLLGDSPQTPPDNPQDTGGSVVVTDAGLFDLHFRDAEIAGILELLSYQARTNIVASTSVKGRISANLYSVTLPEALDAIL